MTLGGGAKSRSHWSMEQQCSLALGHLVVLFAIFLNSPCAGPLCPSSVQILSNSDKRKDIKACTNFKSYFFKEDKEDFLKKKISLPPSTSGPLIPVWANISDSSTFHMRSFVMKL